MQYYIKHNIEWDSIHGFNSNIFPLFIHALNFDFQIQNRHYTQIAFRIIS